MAPVINLKSLNKYVVTRHFKMDNQDNKRVIAQGRLASQARLKGCIFHCPHTLFTPKISRSVDGVFLFPPCLP